MRNFVYVKREIVLLYCSKNKLLFLRWWWRLHCTRPTCLIDMLLHSDTSYWLWAAPFRHIILTMSRSIQTHHTDYEPSFYSYSSKLTVEALNIIIIIFDLTRTKDPTHDLQYLKRLRYLLHRQGQYSKVNVR